MSTETKDRIAARLIFDLTQEVLQLANQRGCGPQHLMTLSQNLFAYVMACVTSTDQELQEGTTILNDGIPHMVGEWRRYLAGPRKGMH